MRAISSRLDLLRGAEDFARRIDHDNASVANELGGLATIGLRWRLPGATLYAPVPAGNLATN